MWRRTSRAGGSSSYARRKLRQQLLRHGAAPSEVARADETLDARALTIGFARRFATYKRAVLLFNDPDRLARIVSDPHRPVQFIFAGKSHPQDQPGKEFIKAIYHWSRDPRFRSHLVFLEDHDMELGRYMVQGVDIWLNTPRRPHEASGTSGMKAAMNGALHMSVLDGWWAEAYAPGVGWSIGGGETYAEEAYQDFVESRAIYDPSSRKSAALLQPRQAELPRGWIGRMKASVKALRPAVQFAPDGDAVRRPAVRSGMADPARLEKDGWKGARELGRLAGEGPRVPASVRCRHRVAGGRRTQGRSRIPRPGQRRARVASPRGRRGGNRQRAARHGRAPAGPGVVADGARGQRGKRPPLHGDGAVPSERLVTASRSACCRAIRRSRIHMTKA